MMAATASCSRVVSTINALSCCRRLILAPLVASKEVRPLRAQSWEWASVMVAKVQRKICASMACGIAKLTSTASTRMPPNKPWMMTRIKANTVSFLTQVRVSLRRVHAYMISIMLPTKPPSSRWPCSARMAGSSTQPSGLIEPLESGQSGKAMPAPIVVVNPPAYSRHSVPANTNKQKAKRRLLGWGAKSLEFTMKSGLAMSWR